MQIIDNLLIFGIHILCFVAGMALANKANAAKERAVKEALERQFLRLKANADADDPVKPYVSAGDFDGDPRPITPVFMDRLRTNGQASMKFRKSDVAK